MQAHIALGCQRVATRSSLLNHLNELKWPAAAVWAVQPFRRKNALVQFSFGQQRVWMACCDHISSNQIRQTRTSSGMLQLWGGFDLMMTRMYMCDNYRLTPRDRESITVNWLSSGGDIDTHDSSTPAAWCIPAINLFISISIFYDLLCKNCNAIVMDEWYDEVLLIIFINFKTSCSSKKNASNFNRT